MRTEYTDISEPPSLILLITTHPNLEGPQGDEDGYYTQWAHEKHIEKVATAALNANLADSRFSTLPRLLSPVSHKYNIVRRAKPMH